MEQGCGQEEVGLWQELRRRWQEAAAPREATPRRDTGLPIPPPVLAWLC